MQLYYEITCCCMIVWLVIYTCLFYGQLYSLYCSKLVGDISMWHPDVTYCRLIIHYLEVSSVKPWTCVQLVDVAGRVANVISHRIADVCWIYSLGDVERHIVVQIWHDIDLSIPLIYYIVVIHFKLNCNCCRLFGMS